MHALDAENRRNGGAPFSRWLRSTFLLSCALWPFTSACGGEPVSSPGPAPTVSESAEVSGELVLASGVAQPIATRGYHTCALLEGGAVKCWGANGVGQLGLGDTANRGDDPEMGNLLPMVKLGAGRTAKAVAVGVDHTCVILDDDQVKCWGGNSTGQLGLGHMSARGDEPDEMGDELPTVNLGPGRTAKALAAGSGHTCAILDTNEVKCWGQAIYGQLGLGDPESRGDASGDMGEYLPTVNLGTGRTAKAITAGLAHTCALLDTNQVKCWGFNGQGQLGQGDGNGRGASPLQMGDALPTVSLGTGRTVKAVSAGDLHTCALLNTNQVKCWGSNGGGQLGQGDLASRGDGLGEMGNSLLPISLGTGVTAKALASGAAHTCAVLNTNHVKCWGFNPVGPLGLGHTETRGDGPGEMGDALPAVDLGTGRTALAVTAGFSHTCAALDTNRVKCWGESNQGQAGGGDTVARGDEPGEMGDALPAVDLGSRANKAVSMGNTHACAVLNNGLVKCWGSNGSGELGQGNITGRGDDPGELGAALPTVQLGAVSTVKVVDAGFERTCAILTNNQLKCWGDNSNGALGLGNTADRGDAPGEMGTALPAVSLGTGRKPKAVSVGANHTCVILDDNTVKCWGLNDTGQLGLGDTSSRGDGAGEMANNLPIVNLGTGRTAKAISAGFGATCAVLDNDSVKCWGGNFVGQLGLGDTSSRGDGPGEMGDSLPAIALGTGRTAKAITAAAGHACAVLDDDSVKCWGANDTGQLGQGDQLTRGDQPGEMGDALPAIGLGTGNTALSVSARYFHTCVLLQSKQVKCWGNAISGQLGLGDTNNRGDHAGEMKDQLPLVPLGTERFVTSLSAGAHSVCALLNTNQIKCWGYNVFGQLGIGDTLSRGDEPGEMDEALPFVDLGSES